MMITAKKSLLVAKTGTTEQVVFVLPDLVATELQQILLEDLESDAAATALLMLSPDTLQWREARKMLIDFSLVGEKSLLTILTEVVAPDTPFTLEEYALATWTSSVLAVLTSLQAQGLAQPAILAAPELQALFN
ncbi:MAG: hypothetical protein RSE47_00040 [Acidaminococcaceae bacterium]